MRQSLLISCIGRRAGLWTSLAVGISLVLFSPAALGAGGGGPCYGEDRCSEGCPDRCDPLICPETATCDNCGCDEGEACVNGECVDDCDEGDDPCSGVCGGGETHPDCPLSDPCKQWCPDLRPVEDSNGECDDAFCGTGCRDDTYCDPNNKPCSEGVCYPLPPGPPGPCRGGCRGIPGAAEFQTGSIKFSFSLGLLAGGYGAPKLWVHRVTPDPSLSRTASLHITQRRWEDRHWPFYAGYSEVPGLQILKGAREFEDPPGQWYSVNDWLQVRAPQAFVDVGWDGVNPLEYRIDFYSPAGIETWDRDWDHELYSEANFYIPPGTPYVRWLVQNPDTSGLTHNRLRITEWAGGTTLVAQYDYTYDYDARAWTLAMGDGTNVLRTEVRSRIAVPSLQQTFETHTVLEGDYPIYESQSIYEWSYSFSTGKSGQRLIEKTVGSGTNTMSSSRTHWPHCDPPFLCHGGLVEGSLQSILRPDGSWSLRDAQWLGSYDSRMTVEVTPWKDQGMPPTPQMGASIRDYQGQEGYGTTLYDYWYPYEHPLYNNLSDTGGFRRRPRMVTEIVQGVVTRETYHIYLTDRSTDPDRDIVVAEQCLNPITDPEPGFWANVGAAGNLTTITEYYPSEIDTFWGSNRLLPPRIQSIEYPDGRKDDYTHARGTYLPGQAASDNPADYFTADTGHTDVMTTIVHDTTIDPGEGLASGVKTTEVIVENAVGQRLLRQVYVSPKGAGRLIEWTEWIYDERGRLVESISSDNRHAETTWEDCCGQSSEVDETGVETVYDYDALGRRTYITKKGVSGVTQDIVTTIGRGGLAGGGYMETTTVSSGSLSLSSRVEYDLAGRMVKSVDQAGLGTTYQYGTASGGGKKVTITHPGGATEITEYYRDGRIKSVTGTAVVAKYYDYWVDEDGYRWTQESIGSDNPANTPFVTKTAVNRLDQTAKTIEYYDTSVNDAVTTTFHYNNRGQLVRKEVSTAAGKYMADTLYVYDDMGVLWRSGLDADGDGVLDEENSDDRVQDTFTDYWYDSEGTGDWWLLTMNTVYTSDTAQGGGAVDTSTILRRLTGLGTGVMAETMSLDEHGNVTTSLTTVNRAAKEVTRSTTHPDSVADEVAVTVNGLLQSSTSKTGLTTTFGYDDLGRLTGVTDPRTGTSQTHYNSAGQIDWTKDATQQQTSYEYYPGVHLNAGRLKAVGNPAGEKQYFSYNARGQQERTWGDTPYPVQYGYDDYGRRTSISTYRAGTGWSGPDWPTSPGPADVTTFVYGGQNPSKWLSERVYADSTSVGYVYKPDGKLSTRTWARTSGGALTTTYSYDPDTGDLTGIDYSDATADVTYTYDRAGRMKTVADAVGTRTWVYNTDNLQLDTETIVAGQTGLYDATIIRDYEDGQGGTVAGRAAGLSIDGAGYNVGYHYDSVGRLDRVTGPGLPAYGGQYGRVANTELIGDLWYKSGESTVLATTHRTYEFEAAQNPTNRKLIRSVENIIPGTPDVQVSKYDYANDPQRGRRTSVIETGTAFAAASYNLYTYNTRSELNDAERYLGSQIENPPQNPVAGEDFRYMYDTIGNRRYYIDAAGTHTCNRNNLNQYYWIGNPATDFTYDDDGNLETDGKYKYLWDAENRLIEVANRIEQGANAQDYDDGDKRLTFKYDYLGRRVEKVYETYDGSAWVEQSRQRFVYDGWNVVMVLDGLDDNAILRKYTWGLDLSGSIHGAGGIGGLLAVEEPQAVGDPERYWYLYDANGNVGQVIDTGDYSIAAKYRYDPFGKTVYAQGPYAEVNPFRFSTKWLDDELTHDPTWIQSAFGATGLYYYGYRCYSPHVGRWINRDPIEEKGGPNLYSTGNNLIDRVDPLGLIIPHPYPRGPRRPLPAPFGNPGQGVCALNFCRRWLDDGTNPYLGHSWIELSNDGEGPVGRVWTFPPGNPDTVLQRDLYKNKYTSCSRIGKADPKNDRRCCAEIWDCLEKAMDPKNFTYAKPPYDLYVPPSQGDTCHTAALRALKACGLVTDNVGWKTNAPWWLLLKLNDEDPWIMW